MNRKDLDALNELYLSVYDGEQLNEGPYSADRVRRVQQVQQGRDAFNAIGGYAGLSRAAADSGDSAAARTFMQRSQEIGDRKKAEQKAASDREQSQRTQNRASDVSAYRNAFGVKQPTNTPSRFARPQNAAPGLSDIRGGNGNTTTPARTPAGSGSTPPPRPAAGSGSTPPPRPAAKPGGIVLARKNNVTGTLDKSTGKFTEKNWTDTETQRYQTRAAQNASKSSPTTPVASAPKPPTPAIGKLGNTSFERRTPTSAELRAAQGERERQKTAGENTSTKQNSEKALQAAQKTNLPTTGPTPAIPDLKSVSADLARANTPANLNRAPAGSAAAKALAVKPATSTPTPSQIAGASQGIKPATPGQNSINNTNSQKKEMVKSSYEWPSAKTIKDIADAYSSIYEAKKKVDQDKDGDNDFADVRVARMVASGVPKEVAIAKVKNKSYNEEVEIDEATAMAKRGHDETPIRRKIAKSTGGGEAADRATALENRPTYGNTAKQNARQNLARAQRGDFRKTTSSNPGLHGYAHKSNDPAVKAKQAARGAQRGVLTPREKKQLNREAYEAYEFVASYLLENNFASTVEDANAIINNMSEGWFNQIIEG